MRSGLSNLCSMSDLERALAENSEASAVELKNATAELRRAMLGADEKLEARINYLEAKFVDLRAALRADLGSAK